MCDICVTYTARCILPSKKHLKANRIGRISPSGTITEYPLLHPDSQPEGLLAGPDGTLWFLEQGGKRVGHIRPSGSITEMPCP
jgi:streptogramin lyase